MRVDLPPLFKQRPAFVAEFIAPIFVKCGLGEHGAERGFVDLQELHTPRREINAQRRRKRNRVGALVVGGLVELLGNDRLDVWGQSRKGAAVGEDEVGIPNVVGETGSIFGPL